MLRMVCYISGHGFGHAVRTIEVLRALVHRRPAIELEIRTPAPAWLFESSLPAGTYSLSPVQLDVGVVQTDSLVPDVAATRIAATTILQQTPALVAAEVAALAPFRPGLIFADIPALAFEIAAQLGIPSIAMTNFSWDWIYAGYAGIDGGFTPVIEALRRAYARATELLRLPLHGDLSAFPHVVDVPLVARHATVGRRAVRERLRLSQDHRIVLLSFGGIGVELTRAPQAVVGVDFVTTTAARTIAAPGVRVLRNEELHRAGVRHEDLVAASDAVMTKPGYGIVAECIANATPMIYTSRGAFAEYDRLVEGVRAQLPSAFISNVDLRAGRWGEAVDGVFAQSHRRPSLATNGANVVAEVVLRYLR